MSRTNRREAGKEGQETMELGKRQIYLGGIHPGK